MPVPLSEVERWCSRCRQSIAPDVLLRWQVCRECVQAQRALTDYWRGPQRRIRQPVAALRPASAA